MGPFTDLDRNIILFIGMFFFLASGLMLVFLIQANAELSEAKGKLGKLMRSFHEIDEQAKLIVKTDLELNKAQEELDKRLNGLEALQKTSRLISTTLDENEIFSRLDQPLMTNLGFEKNLILINDDSKRLHSRMDLGFSKDEIRNSIQLLESDQTLLNSLKEGHAFSSATSVKQRRDEITKIFGVEHFILTPILSQAGMVGVVFVGNRSDASAVTAGDEELISILANQVGQSLENAQLFEQVYRSSQMLESKVQERTKQLASALEEVQKISKTKSEFISAVSHELRTPLTSIKGYASLLMTGKLGDIPEAVKERLDKINKHSDNLVKLINDLLDISRIESGKAELHFAQQPLKPIIDNVHDLLTPQLRERNIRWDVEIEPSTPETFVDRSHIERVFINLVSNAIKFTPPQGSILIRVRPESGAISVQVSDSGIGINSEDLPKLFDEFYRVDNEINQNVKGTGLGLSLVKKIIEAHNGKISATSELNKGTTFHFTLPVEKPAQT